MRDRPNSAGKDYIFDKEKFSLQTTPAYLIEATFCLRQRCVCAIKLCQLFKVEHIKSVAASRTYFMFAAALYAKLKLTK